MTRALHQRRQNRSHPIFLSPPTKELGIAVAAYSLWTNQETRGPLWYANHPSPRFQETNIRHNIAIVDALAELAKKKNITQ
ncbi:hypothetical protein JVU11DRAFT_11794 [Chiua virens]|nr:hypothetical protein JVU11DRAFT_11794 [Chiua virens]